MMPMTRQEIEVLLDTPDQHDYVVSAYADLTVQDGFNHFAERHLRNQAKAVEDVLSEAKARKSLDENLEVIRRAVAAADPSAKGLAVFSSAARGLNRVLHLSFPVENRLVVDEEPYLLPLLEHWYGEPTFLIALVDSDEAHLLEAHHGIHEPVRDLERQDVHQDIQRDKPRFIYKKRFAQTQHESLHGMEDDRFLHRVADTLDKHWSHGQFAGLILLGQSQITGPLRRLLPRDLAEGVVAEASHAMTTRPDDLDDVIHLIQRARAEREQQVLGELNERWKQKHRVANGPTDVLDALQQGRAVQVFFGTRRDMPGARCSSCGYRFGAPVQVCPYCQGRCQATNAAQDILRMAMRHRVPVTFFRRRPKDDPLTRANGVAAFLRAEANWAADRGTEWASEGHPGSRP
jgi:protein required for attachment to host cells